MKCIGRYSALDLYLWTIIRTEEGTHARIYFVIILVAILKTDDSTIKNK